MAIDKQKHYWEKQTVTLTSAQILFVTRTSTEENFWFLLNAKKKNL